MTGSEAARDCSVSCKGLRVLVCGGRGYSDQRYLNGYLDGFHNRMPIGLIIEGGASGADSLARTWAILRNIPYQTFHARWEQYGQAAGAIRNVEMLEDGKPDQVVAFPGGNGTDNMVKIAKVAVIAVEDLRKLALR